MSYLVIEDFKAGLDLRGSMLRSKPGTLTSLINGHINAGGEVEKRFKFTSLGKVSASPTFGFVPTSTRLYVFGSVAAATVNATLNSSPTGLYYQQLKHPEDSELASSNYDMTAAFGTAFNDKPFVVATFEDNRTFCYYDGTIVGAFRNGLILPSMTSLELVSGHIEDMLNTVDGLTAVYAETVDSQHAITVTGVPGQQLSMTAFRTKASDGTVDETAINIAKVQEGKPGVAGTMAVASFRIIDGTTGGKVNSITVNGINILDPGVGVVWQGTAEQTVASLVEAINTYKSYPDFTATQDGTTLFINAPASEGDDMNTEAFTMTVSGKIAVHYCAFTVSGSNGDTVNSITPSGGSDLLDSTPIDNVGGNNAAWATEIAAYIEANSTTWTAYATNNKVYLSKRVTTSGDADIPVAIDYTSAGTAVVEVPVTDPGEVNPLTLGIINSTIYYEVEFVPDAPGANYTYGLFTKPAKRYPASIGLAVAGGVGPYFGEWKYTGYTGPNNGGEGNKKVSAKWDASLENWQDPVFQLDITIQSVGDKYAARAYYYDMLESIYTFELTVRDSDPLGANVKTLTVQIVFVPTAGWTFPL